MHRPTAKENPLPKLVAVTTDRRELGPASPPSGRVRPQRPEVFLGATLVGRLRDLGVEPLLVAPHDGSAEAIEALIGALLPRVDGLVLTGGSFDIHPSHYGQAPAARLDRIDAGRTALELGLARVAMAQGLPLVGLCGGMQAMVVAAGGSLVQDISTHLPGALEHEQPTDPSQAWHPVQLTGGPLLDAVGGAGLIEVNSTHHQAVDRLGALVLSGTAPDGVPEVVHHPGLPFALGVQWHPEYLDDDAVLAAFVAALG